jgi:hypothetical protein
MPPRPVAVLTAEGVSFDQLTSRMTAFNILEVVFAGAIPSRLNKLGVACIYEMGPEPATFFERAELVAPDGKPLWASVIHVDLAAREPGTVPNAHRTIHGLWNVVVSATGDHKLRISHGSGAEGPWETVAERCLTVIERPHPIFAAGTESAREE